MCCQIQLLFSVDFHGTANNKLNMLVLSKWYELFTITITHQLPNSNKISIVQQSRR